MTGGITIQHRVARTAGGVLVRIAAGRAELLRMIEQATSPQPAPPQPDSPPPATRKAGVMAGRGRGRGRHRGRGRVELRNAADLRRLLLRLCIPRKTPFIVVSIEAFSALERQRTQTRITRLAEVSQYQYGGPVAAAAVLLLGAAHLIRSMVDEWKYLLWLVLATTGAWLLGRWLGALWCRLRLQAALLRLWRRVRSRERAA